MSELKPPPPRWQPSGRVKHGKASVTWGPRMYGPDTIVANAPIDAIGDLVEAVALARKQYADTNALDIDCESCGVKAGSYCVGDKGLPRKLPCYGRQRKEAS